MESCGMLACLLAVLSVIPQSASGQLNQFESPANNNRWSCAKWHNRLEETLIADNEIMRQLLDTFFPISGRAPFILVMEYDIFYLSNGTVEVKSIHQGWSSSAVLSVVHPAIIIHWQPWLEAIFLLQGMINYTTINIPLIVAEDIEFTPDPELKCAVKKITSWLKAYAEYQGKPQRWDIHSKGFTWEEDRTSAADVLVIVATLAAQMLLQLYLKKNVFETVSQCLEQETIWRLCVWSAGDALSVLGLVLLAPYGTTLYLICLVGGAPFALLSLISLFIVILSTWCWGVVGVANAHNFPTDSRWPFLHGGRYFFLFVSYVLCANIAAQSAVPTLLLVMVFPLESISAIGLGCFVFFVLAMLILLCRSQTLKDCSFSFHMLILIVVITCVVGVYVSILFTGSGTNEYLQTFLPSLGAVVVGYWIKKFLDKNKRSKEQEIPR